MPVSKYKYRIDELMNKLYVNDYRKAMRTIPDLLSVSIKTFANYRNIKLDDIQDIPHEKVALLEKLFKIQPGELQNFTWIVDPLFETLDYPINKPQKVSL